MNNSERNSHLAFAALLALLLALPIFALFAEPARSDTPRCNRGESTDTWKAGIIDGALLFNHHLQQYRITPQVSGDQARLSGAVSSHAERALAEQIALSVEGIKHIDNQIVIAPDAIETRKAEALSQPQFSDSAVTTKVKSQLLANAETSGLNIEVETRDNVVTLTGEVPSALEKELAFFIARNTGGVHSVINDITIKPRA